MTVEAGAVYTGFAVGYLEPDEAPADESFDLEVVEDAPANGEDDTSEDAVDGDDYDGNTTEDADDADDAA